MVPAAAERKSVGGAERTQLRRLEHRPRPLRICARAAHPPQPHESRRRPHQNPPRPRPRPRPHHHHHLPMAGPGPARRPHHPRPPQRRPGRLPAPGPRAGVDAGRALQDPRQPQIHRLPGPGPHPPRQPHPAGRGPAGPVDLVPRTHPPRTRGQAHLGHGPAHQRRPRQRPGRRTAQDPARPPLPVPGTAVVQDLQTADARRHPHLHHHPPGHRAHLLPMSPPTPATRT
jgi:hypothetical protein